MSRDPRLPAMMRLWQDSFGDSDAFVRLFFTRVYRPRNALTLTRDGCLAAMLHIVPYRLRVGHRTLPAAYICGVSTRREVRGRGLMTDLMRRALRTMRRRRFAIATLIPAEPWLFDVYAPRPTSRLAPLTSASRPAPTRASSPPSTACNAAAPAPSCTRRATLRPSAATACSTAAVSSRPWPAISPSASFSRRPKRAAWCASRSCSRPTLPSSPPYSVPPPRVMAPRVSAFVAPRALAGPRCLTASPRCSTSAFCPPTFGTSTWR